ncbi:helix-turn-helix domain-containing protein, partial [Marinimicrobium sp. ABcell2]|uniref:helix-turn-helix domain-containing protein n=1 Tax=Marinimicrobium sp. ABcell2 TaxID=3069751 RepID=UPI0027B30CEA
VQDLPPHIQNPNSTVRQRGSSLTINIGTSVAEVEKNLIMATLDQCGGRKEKAAGILGVSVKTLYNRLREYEERVLTDNTQSDTESNQ